MYLLMIFGKQVFFSVSIRKGSLSEMKYLLLYQIFPTQQNKCTKNEEMQ